MKVIRKGESPEQDRSGAPIFFGGKVTSQAIVSGDDSNYFNFSIVSFEAGARNKFHTHTSDQILFVTNGLGIIASESEEIEIREGDTAFIPAGEKHWHGSTPDSAFGHVSLTSPGSSTEVFD